MMKYFVILLTFYFCYLPARSQQNRVIDSLTQFLQTNSSQLQDTSRAKALNILAWEYKFINPDTSIILSMQSLLLAQKNNWEKGEAESFHRLGTFNYIKGIYLPALDYYNTALKIRKQLHDKKGISVTLGGIAAIYNSQGNYSQSLDYNLQALKIAESIPDKVEIARHLGNIGLLYMQQKDFPKALDYYFRALPMQRELGDKSAIAAILNNIGVAYIETKDISKALDYYLQVLKMAEELGDKNYITLNHNNIGSAYYELAKNSEFKNKKTSDSLFKESLASYHKALQIAKEIGSQEQQAYSLGRIGEAYIAVKQYDKAYGYLNDALTLANDIGSVDYISEFEKHFSILYEKTNQPAKALEHYKKHIAAKDSIFNEENTTKIVRSEMNFEFEKKEAIAETQHKSELEKQAAVSEAEQKRKNVIIGAVVGGLLLIMVFAGFILRSLNLTRKQKQFIEIKNKETEEQKKIIEEKNTDITASITYAKRIQNAMLPDQTSIKTVFQDSFILYKPKDIVSGDFYFFSPSPVSKNTFFIAAADCTGHGVPGAFMSLIGNEKLKDAVSQSNEPSQVLNLLNKGIKTSLHQSSDELSTRDGMDIALLRIDLHRQAPAVVTYAGANRPLWIIRHSADSENNIPAIEEIKGTKKAIGGLTEDEQFFSSHTLSLQKGDAIFIFTDGYADLFGSAGKKLTTKKFKQLLLDSYNKPMAEQGKQLETFAEIWRGNTGQIDDILVIGIRL